MRFSALWGLLCTYWVCYVLIGFVMYLLGLLHFKVSHLLGLLPCRLDR